MAPRVIPFVNGEIYHVYNRGAGDQPTYLSKREYERFLLCLSYYRFKEPPVRLSRLLQLEIALREEILLNLQTHEKLVELIAYCLMPNHFHLVLRQLVDGGLSRFMRHVSDSYTRYFNTKHQRSGSIFRGPFKVVHVSTDEQLIHLSRYVHINPLVAFIIREENFLSYPWSSLNAYLNGDSDLVNPKIVLEHFKSPKYYLEFIMDQADYGKELEKIKHLTLESSRILKS